MEENQADARCYLIDAERLLRLRGLTKRTPSRRARLLHHVYTWLRIIGESTFALHDYANPTLLPRMESNLPGLQIGSNSMTEDLGCLAVAHSKLDDFLHVETQIADVDLDREAFKELEVGIRDIHLEDLRDFSDTLYFQAYGISETWLSLVSLTTRLANVLDVVTASKTEASRLLRASLEKKSTRLETMVCSLASRTPEAYPSLLDSTEGTLSGPSVTSASTAMHRAMNAALVIFFYRRIRNVHPWILQIYVKNVVEALRDFDRDITRNSTYKCGTVGTPWPAFIAGCEAITKNDQAWFVAWLRERATKSPSAGTDSALDVMREVWRRRAAARDANATHAHSHHSGVGPRGNSHVEFTWVRILQERKNWPMLY